MPGCAWIALAACSIDPQPGHVFEPPNVLLILADDLGYSDIGAFGGEIRTPTLDRLARDGIRFTQFHTTAKCFPSRAALLTGLYPEQVGMDETAQSQISAGTTIAAALRQAGYRTYMVGKHHATDHPMDLGFDRYVGLRDGAANHFNPGTVARPGEPVPARKAEMAPAGRWWCFDRDCMQGYVPPERDFYSTDFYTDKALEYLADAQSQGAPFFMYLSYQAPHDPLHAWPEDIEPYLPVYTKGFEAIAGARYERQRATGVLDDRYPRSAPVFGDFASLGPAERSEEVRRMAVYAAMTDRLDQGLARIVRFLETSDELENTLIVFASDNGASAERVWVQGTTREIGSGHAIGSVGRWASLGANWANVSNTPFRWFKNYSYAGGTASPLIAHWPAGIGTPGRIVHSTAHLIDIFPTLLEVSGAIYPARTPGGEPSPPLEGVSLGPALASEIPLARDMPVFQRWQRGRMVRTERWKLLSWTETGKTPEDGAWELYDMQNDRTETTDVAAEFPEVVVELGAAYDAWIARVKPSL